MNPLRLLIIWITLCWTLSNFLMTFWDWHIPNCIHYFWCSLNRATYKETVTGACQKDSWGNQTALASNLFFFFFSVRKHNALTFSGWSIFIFDFEITSCFAFFFFLIILYILWTCVWHPGWKEASSDLNSCTDIHCCIFTPLHTANQTVTYKPYHYSIIYFIIYYCFIFYLSTLL